MILKRFSALVFAVFIFLTSFGVSAEMGDLIVSAVSEEQTELTVQGEKTVFRAKAENGTGKIEYAWYACDEFGIKSGNAISSSDTLTVYARAEDNNKTLHYICVATDEIGDCADAIFSCTVSIAKAKQSGKEESKEDPAKKPEDTKKDEKKPYTKVSPIGINRSTAYENNILLAVLTVIAFVLVLVIVFGNFRQKSKSKYKRKKYKEN